MLRLCILVAVEPEGKGFQFLSADPSVVVGIQLGKRLISILPRLRLRCVPSISDSLGKGRGFLAAESPAAEELRGRGDVPIVRRVVDEKRSLGRTLPKVKCRFRRAVQREADNGCLFVDICILRPKQRDGRRLQVFNLEIDINVPAKLLDG